MSQPVLVPPASENNFTPHPQGSFMGTCCDVYIKTEANQFFGKPKDKNDPSKGIDNNREVTNAYISFMTTEMMEYQGQMQPMKVTLKNKFAWGGGDKRTNLFKAIRGWYPQATDDQIEKMDISNLKGRFAYLTIAHKKSADGTKTYANIVGIAPPPPGMQGPAIPSTFRTYYQQLEASQAQPPVAPIGVQPQYQGQPIQQPQQVQQPVAQPQQPIAQQPFPQEVPPSMRPAQENWQQQPYGQGQYGAVPPTAPPPMSEEDYGGPNPFGPSAPPNF